jgi:metal-sulfur cluster biosynthetic enzyme
MMPMTAAPERTNRPPFQMTGHPTELMRVMLALRAVIDPEVEENIVDLGLIERLELEPGRAELVLVTMSATCPMSDLIAEEAFRAMQRALPDTDLFVRHDPDVEWTPGRMSPEVRWRLGGLDT